jgi:uracil-DNA glycosylase
MRWTERQQTLLQAMGLRLWLPPGAAAAAAAQLADGSPPHAAVAAEAPAARPAPPAAVAAPPVPAGPAVATAADHLDWPALRDAVTGCRACGLCETRRQTVFGVGHPQAHCMVVGEAPGEQEDAEGEPFVGASGQLLDRMLAALQLTRSAEGELPLERRVYIANTLKCRPPRNRNPTADEMQRCEPYLMRQIALLRPRIILAMGKFAIQMLLRTDAPVGKLRGQVHQYQGVPLVVTYHPAYLLRSLGEKARAWEDLCLAADIFERTSPGPRDGAMA